MIFDEFYIPDDDFEIATEAYIQISGRLKKWLTAFAKHCRELGVKYKPEHPRVAGRLFDLSRESYKKAHAASLIRDESQIDASQKDCRELSKKLKAIMSIDRKNSDELNAILEEMEKELKKIEKMPRK